jgi:ribonuclease-3
MLYRAFPRGDEGELSRRLADLVRRETCADVARAIDLGAELRLGNSESNAGGRRRTAILADVCEALIGAVFVDGGYPAAAAMIERLWQERMLTPPRPLRDAKTDAAGMGAGARPADAGLSRGRAHRAAPQSGIPRRGRVRGPRAGRGIGRSKRAAEQAAAGAMLTREGDGCGRRWLNREGRAAASSR